MGQQRHTKESIGVTIRALAERLKKDTLATSDLNGVVSMSVINYHFGSLGNALEALGLRRRAPGENLKESRQTLSERDLFGALHLIEQQLGREPRRNEVNAFGDFSVRPYVTRFGKWSEVLQFYRKWKAEGGATVAQSSDSSADFHEPRFAAYRTPPTPQIVSYATTESAKQLYGEPIDFRGLRHAPI